MSMVVMIVTYFGVETREMIKMQSSAVEIPYLTHLRFRKYLNPLTKKCMSYLFVILPLRFALCPRKQMEMEILKMQNFAVKNRILIHSGYVAP